MSHDRPPTSTPRGLRTLARVLYLAGPGGLVVGIVATLQHARMLEGPAALTLIATAPAGLLLLTVLLYTRCQERGFLLWASFAAATLQLVMLDAADRTGLIYGGM